MDRWLNSFSNVCTATEGIVAEFICPTLIGMQKMDIQRVVPRRFARGGNEADKELSAFLKPSMGRYLGAHATDRG